MDSCNHRKTGALQRSLDLVIANTRRGGKRQVDLLTLSQHLGALASAFGSVHEAAKRAMVSDEMARQFVVLDRDLSDPVRKALRERRIDNVDAAYRLTRFSPDEQVCLAEALMEKKIDANDLRALVTARADHPDWSLDQVVETVLNSKTVHQYVLEFQLPSRVSMSELRERFSQAFGSDNVHEVRRIPQGVRLRISADGKGRLESMARGRRIRRAALVQSVAIGEITG